MRKFIKKIATVVATVTMMSAMAISAFAETDDDYFSIAGDARLFNVNDAESSDYWSTVLEDLELPAVDGMEGVFAKTFTSAAAGDLQFKILKNGADFGWSYQCCLGNPDVAWADNQTQFQAAMAAGEYTVYVKPSTGFVCIIQNKESVDMVIRYHSRDEDPTNFVAITKAAIEGEGYKDVPDFEAEYTKFVNECVVKEGGTPVEPETTTLSDDDKKETTLSEEKKTTKADKDEDDGISPVIIVVVVVAVVAVIAVIVALSKKKKND